MTNVPLSSPPSWIARDPRIRRWPVFVERDGACPPKAVSVDGNVAGAALTLSHWHEAPLPPVGIRGDTGTGMVLAAIDAGLLADGVPVVSEHIDADGLLAIMVACRPDLAASRDLILAAAECGDFARWTGERPFRLMLVLHQLIKRLRDAEGDWEQAAADSVVGDVDALLAATDAADPQRDSSVARHLAARATRSVHADPLLSRIAWDRVHGHHWDVFLDIDSADDAPIRALSSLLPDTACQLWSERSGNGWTHVVDAPRHAWARTWNLPAFTAPDLAPTCAALQTLERNPVTWTIRPRCSFSGLLASLDGQIPAASSIPPEQVATIVAKALAT